MKGAIVSIIYRKKGKQTEKCSQSSSSSFPLDPHLTLISSGRSPFIPPATLWVAVVMGVGGGHRCSHLHSTSPQFHIQIPPLLIYETTWRGLNSGLNRKVCGSQTHEENSSLSSVCSSIANTCLIVHLPTSPPTAISTRLDQGN